MDTKTKIFMWITIFFIACMALCFLSAIIGFFVGNPVSGQAGIGNCFYSAFCALIFGLIFFYFYQLKE